LNFKSDLGIGSKLDVKNLLEEVVISRLNNKHFQGNLTVKRNEQKGEIDNSMEDK
jgi:hypothetical protein